MRLWNFRGEQNTITEALRISIPDHAVISLTGSGGKTTLLSSWGRELSSSGKRVVLTTTAHMGDPLQPKEGHPDPCSGISVLYMDGCSSEPDSALIAQYESLLDKDRIVLAAEHDSEKPFKVKSPPDWMMDHIRSTADVVLIEADGSRRLPLKWPAPWEPVVPDYTDITVCVAGLSALGQTIEKVMYGLEYIPQEFRKEYADETFISSVLASSEGGQKGSRGEFRVFLNQADTDRLRQSAARIQQILGAYGIQSAWGSLMK